MSARVFVGAARKGGGARAYHENGSCERLERRRRHPVGRGGKARTVRETTREQAEARGLGPCRICSPRGVVAT